MKQLFLAVLLMFSSQSFALGYNMQHPDDYIMHSVGGFIITDYMEYKGYSRIEILGTVAAVAIAKELSDKNFDWNDAAAWMPGSIIRFSMPLD